MLNKRKRPQKWSFFTAKNTFENKANNYLQKHLIFYKNT